MTTPVLPAHIQGQNGQAISPLQTLYWMDCEPGFGPCTASSRDSVLAVRAEEVEQLHDLGYNYHGRQGYIYPVCGPEPACMPAGTVRLYRRCSSLSDDCAIFPESQLDAMSLEGYTQAAYPGAAQILGYVYPNQDQDADGLPDGMEYLLGTDPYQPDSDGDGLSDGEEYPAWDLPQSDPRLGEIVFADSFED